MKKYIKNAVAILLATIFMLLIMQTKGFAANENIQVVKTENGYVIYVKDMENKDFKYAISKNPINQNDETESVNLNYINSVKDQDGEEGNSVALISEEAASNAKYLYIKGSEKSERIELNLEKDVIEKSEIALVEKTTNRIKTELLTNIEQRNEEVDGVKYTETVGGIKIADDTDAKYQYISVKLPNEKYNEFKEKVDVLNINYQALSMYEKIEYAKEFTKIFDGLIESANTNKTWKDVDENLVITQPQDAKDGERYIVLLKKVKDGEISYDAKFMLSYREDNEEKIPGRTETKTVQETAKLPVTNDNLILFGILAVIAIALILVFIRMKKIKHKGRH